MTGVIVLCLATVCMLASVGVAGEKGTKITSTVTTTEWRMMSTTSTYCVNKIMENYAPIFYKTEILLD